MSRYQKINCPVSDGFLKEMYEDQCLCVSEITTRLSRLLNREEQPVAKTLVRKWLLTAGVTMRSTSAAHRVVWRKPEGRQRRKRQGRILKQATAPYRAMVKELAVTWRPACTCAQCGKPFNRAPALVKNTLAGQGFAWEQGQPLPAGARLFCERDCYNAYIRRGKTGRVAMAA